MLTKPRDIDTASRKTALKGGACVDTEDEDSAAALLCLSGEFVKHGYSHKVAKILISAGASIHPRDRNGWTALRLANWNLPVAVSTRKYDFWAFNGMVGTE